MTDLSNEVREALLSAGVRICETPESGCDCETPPTVDALIAAIEAAQLQRLAALSDGEGLDFEAAFVKSTGMPIEELGHWTTADGKDVVSPVFHFQKYHAVLNAQHGAIVGALRKLIVAECAAKLRNRSPLLAPVERRGWFNAATFLEEVK